MGLLNIFLGAAIISWLLLKCIELRGCYSHLGWWFYAPAITIGLWGCFMIAHGAHSFL